MSAWARELGRTCGLGSGCGLPPLGRLVGLALLALCVLPAAPLAAQPTAPYQIELGDAVVLPGQTEFHIPVYLTTNDPLGSWQMGLDYDDLLVALVGIDFTDTVSEPLGPSVQWGPTSSPPYTSLLVAYPLATPFPAGERLLAARLRFELTPAAALLPPGGSLTMGIGITNVEPYPVLFADTVGGTVIPASSGGSLTILGSPALLIEEVDANFFDDDGVIRVPVRAWTSGPSSVLEMGLDYDDLLMCTFDLAGGEIEAALGDEAEVTLIDAGTHVVVRIETTGAEDFPLFDGDTIGFLEMLIGPTPFAGEFPLILLPGECFVDGMSVLNLVDGRLTLADHFVRGDANFDGAIHISDAQIILGRTLLGLPVPCDDAADVNDDAKLDISDPIFLLNHMFLSGSTPPAPFPEPGPDPTADPFGCL